MVQPVSMWYTSFACASNRISLFSKSIVSSAGTSVMAARMRGDVPPKTRSQLPGPADVPFWCLLWPVAHDSFLNHMLGIPWQNMVSEHALSQHD